MEPIGESRKRLLLKTGFYIISTALVLFWLIPLVLAFFTSVKSMDEIMGKGAMWAFPKEWRFDNYVRVWTSIGMGRYVYNTIIITVPSVMGTLALSTLAAFALAFYRFRLNTFILVLFIAGMLIPFQMLMIPVFRFTDSVGLMNTRRGVIFFHIAFQLGFCTFFLRNFLRQVPFSLVEAPRIDGASDFRIYWQVILPLARPSLAALAVLQFTWIWNDLLWSLVLLQSDKLKPVTLGLANMQGEFVSYYNMTASGSIVAMILPLVFFLLFQRYFISGMTVGAVKG
ncbi:MAG: carbohydrate ABC transporter permease [Clostridia bacterium]|jgi:multiple sugar transport system permease protein|nr:carbohydrate ABC transporter permease [Spirochaetia bacterium]